MTESMMRNIETIDISEYSPSGEGGTALTYKHNHRNSLVKLYNPGFEAEMAVAEFSVSKAVYDMGVPTPQPFRLVTDGERIGAEYEFVVGKRSFARVISDEVWRLQEISEAFASAGKKLHATHADTRRIPAIKDVLRSFYLSKDYVIPEHKQRALEFLDSIQEPDTCVHGDFHMGNIITDGKRTLWIDIGQFGYGAPEWDLGWLWTMTHSLGDKRADFLLHLSQNTLTAFWDAFIPAYLGTSDSDVIGNYTRKILAYYAVRVPYMFHLTFKDKFPEEGSMRLIKFIEAGA